MQTLTVDDVLAADAWARSSAAAVIGSVSATPDRPA
jgi:hypothetical protein